MKSKMHKATFGERLKDILKKFFSVLHLEKSDSTVSCTQVNSEPWKSRIRPIV